MLGFSVSCPPLLSFIASSRPVSPAETDAAESTVARVTRACRTHSWNFIISPSKVVGAVRRFSEPSKCDRKAAKTSDSDSAA
jgi:hypothetical protein